MTEILFKAKTKDGKRWVQGYYFAKPILEKHYIICDEAQWEIDKDTLCRYTGFTDKNGNKIWENDICQCAYKGGITECFVVKFGRNVLGNHKTFGFYASWALTDSYRTDICFWVEERGAESIGNIFDNPELLKVESMEDKYQKVKSYLAEKKEFPSMFETDELENVYILFGFGGKRFAVPNQIPVSSVSAIDFGQLSKRVGEEKVIPIVISPYVAKLFEISDVEINMFALGRQSKILKTPSKYGFHNGGAR